MGFLLGLIPDWLKLPLAGLAGLLIGAGLMFFPAKWIGADQERQAAKISSLSKSVEILRERNAIDEEVSAFDALAMCRALGLSDSDTSECVRRLATPHTGARNGGQNHNGR